MGRRRSSEGLWEGKNVIKINLHIKMVLNDKKYNKNSQIDLKIYTSRNFYNLNNNSEAVEVHIKLYTFIILCTCPPLKPETP